MARKFRRASLYEIIKDSRLKAVDGKDLGKPSPLRRAKKWLKSSVKTSQKPAEKPLEWPRKPRIFQFNSGRLEISLPYEFAVAFILGVVLVGILGYRLGQWQGPPPAGQSGPIGAQGSLRSTSLPSVDTAGITKIPETELQKKAGSIEKVTMVEPLADHRIVIKQYQVYADLIPVQKHFAAYGIETEIEQRGDWYFLLTRDKFENPEKPGTDGYVMKQKIINVGARYQAPQGYETFAPGLFNDAYGERIR